MNKECALILKQVINNKYNDIKLDNINYDEKEFYYEFKTNNQVSENDFKSIENEMLKINNNIFIKLIRISSVYYNGDSNNEMITRISGKSFDSLDELEQYEEFIIEAKQRDHRRIGQELDLFCFSEYVGNGLPLYTPRGTIVKDELQKEIEKICRKYGFQKVSCPSLADISLFETSGHATKFNDELFRVSSPKGHEFVLKPVQCPHHTQIYASRLRSYKDLPIRYMESDKQYRAELQGAVGGLSRVYAINVEDGHSFCRIDQVKDEIINMCNLIKDFYSRMGLWNNHWVSLSVRDYSHPEKYIGLKEDWDLCESMLEEISNELGLDAKRCEGEAALYGPKLDFMFKDALGREIQIPTVQVNIIPINIKYHDEYCKKIKNILLDEDIRVQYDDSEERFNKKLLNSNVLKNPCNIIIGDNERDNNLISYRMYNSENTITLSIDEFIKFIKKEINKR